MSEYTGAVARNIWDKAGERPSVLDWIPVALHAGIRAGTNTDNLSAYFQAAIDAGAPTLYVPDGKYHIGTTLNITARRTGFRLYGCSSMTASSGRRGSILVGDTGSTPIIDLSGSFGVTLEDLYLEAGTSSPSTIGILMARTNSLLSQYIRQKHVYIFLGHNPLANGGHGTIAWYTYGAELQTYDSVIGQADNCVIMTRTNVCGLTSPYQTLYSGETSMTEVIFLGANSLYGGNGPAMWFDGTQRVTATDTYFSVEPGYINYNFCFRFTGDNIAVRLTGHIEGFPCFATASGLLDNCHFDCDLPALSLDLIELTGTASIKNTYIKIRPNSEIFHNLISGTGAGEIGNNIIYLQSTQRLNYPNGFFYSCLILAGNTNPTITLGSDATYTLVRPDAVVQKGNVKVLDFLDMRNGNSLRGEDSAGTLTSLVSLAGDDTLSVGTLSATATNGDVIFYVNGLESGRFDSTRKFYARAGAVVDGTATADDVAVNSLASAGIQFVKTGPSGNLIPGGKVDLADAGDVTATGVATGKLLQWNGSAVVGVDGGAPASAKYIVQEASADLTAEQSLGALSTGILKNSSSGGVGTLSTVAGQTGTFNYVSSATPSFNSVIVKDGAGANFLLTYMSGLTSGSNSMTFTDGVKVS